MDQPPAVDFTAFTEVWPRATGNGNRLPHIHHWRGRNFDFLSLQKCSLAVSAMGECWTPNISTLAPPIK